MDKSEKLTKAQTNKFISVGKIREKKAASLQIRDLGQSSQSDPEQSFLTSKQNRQSTENLNSDFIKKKLRKLLRDQKYGNTSAKEYILNNKRIKGLGPKVQKLKMKN